MNAQQGAAEGLGAGSDSRSRGQGLKTLVATAEAGGKLPVGCPAWHDRAVVVPVVPVAADFEFKSFALTLGLKSSGRYFIRVTENAKIVGW
jgi:hypothetical protein